MAGRFLPTDFLTQAELALRAKAAGAEGDQRDNLLAVAAQIAAISDQAGELLSAMDRESPELATVDELADICGRSPERIRVILCCRATKEIQPVETRPRRFVKSLALQVLSRHGVKPAAHWEDITNAPTLQD